MCKPTARRRQTDSFSSTGSPGWTGSVVAAPARLLSIFLLALLASLALSPLGAQDLPAGVAQRTVDLWSEGTRISGDVFTPPGFTPNDSRPAIVMSHGWGGTRAHLNQAYAPFFAAEGFVVLTIDYRGWGDSDSRLVLTGKQPEPDENGKIEVEVKALRNIVDPFDQTEDIRNAITFIEGEPGVDPERIGLWGSSYSGGHVIWVAAHDPRVKVTVSQVASMDSVDFIADEVFLKGGLAEAHRQEIARVRGDTPPYAEAAPAPGLSGTPDWPRIAHYSPRSVAHRVQAAALILDAENEELFDRLDNGRAVHAILRNRVPTEYHVMPGITHYGIYREKREEALALAIAWYKKHL